MSAANAMPLASIVTILAILLYFYMGLRVASMRGKHKIDAPAVSGHPEFDRTFRAHMNTLEAMPVFLPLLWLATYFFPAKFDNFWWLPGALGVVWVIGRYFYMQGYIAEATKRSTGFLISALAQLALLLIALAGSIMAWSSGTTTV
jgi:glutathione S-transferase